MRKRKFIFGGLAGLMFMAFVAVNLTVSQSYDQDGTAQMALTELAAKAQGGRDMANDYYLEKINCSLNWPECYVYAAMCLPAQGWSCDISIQSSCSWYCH